jgi:class 3 adenylate cyclase
MSSRQFYVKPPPMASTSPPTPEAASERRRVTVMFCDLVDSTGIAAKLDAEEWRDLVGAYLDAALAAVLEMGGKVAKKLGDGLMALFGYPVAQENDAERAVRAALAIQRALAELNRKNADTGKPALAARIAIDQGRWLSMRRARYSATCGTSRRGHRRWRSRVRSWSRHGCSDRSRVCSSPKSA